MAQDSFSVAPDLAQRPTEGTPPDVKIAELEERLSEALKNIGVLKKELGAVREELRLANCYAEDKRVQVDALEADIKELAQDIRQLGERNTALKEIASAFVASLVLSHELPGARKHFEAIAELAGLTLTDCHQEAFGEVLSKGAKMAVAVDEKRAKAARKRVAEETARVGSGKTFAEVVRGLGFVLIEGFEGDHQGSSTIHLEPICSNPKCPICSPKDIR